MKKYRFIIICLLANLFFSCNLGVKKKMEPSENVVKFEEYIQILKQSGTQTIDGFKFELVGRDAIRIHGLNSRPFRAGNKRQHIYEVSQKYPDISIYPMNSENQKIILRILSKLDHLDEVQNKE